MSGLSSWFGFDAADNANKAAESGMKVNSKIQKGYGGLFDQILPQAKDLLSQLGDYQGGHALGAALNGLNASPQGRIDAFGRGATENANKNAQATANFYRSQGLGDGAQEGAANAQFQNAATQTNAYSAQENSPEAQMARITAYLQAYGLSTQTITNLLAQLSGGAFGAPQVQGQQNPLLGLLGQAAGAYTSAYAGAAGKKAGA